MTTTKAAESMVLTFEETDWEKELIDWPEFADEKHLNKWNMGSKYCNGQKKSEYRKENDENCNLSYK